MFSLALLSADSDGPFDLPSFVGGSRVNFLDNSLLINFVLLSSSESLLSSVGRFLLWVLVFSLASNLDDEMPNFLLTRF